MIQRAFYSAFAAILLSATLIQTAAAYPSTARSGTSTVTGTYRPLDLDLTLVDGTEALDYDFTNLTFEAIFSGTFTGDGYSVSGQAGNWRLVLNDTSDAGVTSNSDGNVIYMSSDMAGRQVGTLTYLGGLIVTTGSLPVDGSDTPQNDDVFDLFTTATGNVLEVECDDIDTCDNFNLKLLQDLQHLGPYNWDGDFRYFDERRVNEDCEDGDGYAPCGSVTLTASSVTASSIPEPATLALLGLGLAGLSLSRRARA